MTEHPLNEPRRRDRARDETWIRTFLREAGFGFLATVRDGQPFLNSNLFVYAEKEGAIYLHTARAGRTRTNLDEESPVCFSAGAMGRLLPAGTALEFSVEYASVVVFGKGRVVTDPAEAEAALQLLLNKYAPHLRAGRDYRPITPGELERTTVYRVDIESWSGKMKKVEGDAPGAFRFPEPDRFPPAPSAPDPGAGPSPAGESPS
jgi:nitroimidazol reductase NimA-like FMN-containing flavoprotein (pyridoxamine 5'-phosphate oxidase superfamily)